MLSVVEKTHWRTASAITRQDTGHAFDDITPVPTFYMWPLALVTSLNTHGKPKILRTPIECRNVRSHIHPHAIRSKFSLSPSSVCIPNLPCSSASPKPSTNRDNEMFTCNRTTRIENKTTLSPVLSFCIGRRFSKHLFRYVKSPMSADSRTLRELMLPYNGLLSMWQEPLHESYRAI